MSNPLVKDTPNDLGFVNFTSEDNAFAAGGGAFYDAASTVSDFDKGNWVSLGIDGAADALDLLGFLADPFGVLLAAPIGWIIEHIGFLKEALDLVAGDPDAVRNMATTWQNIAAAMEKSAGDYTASADALEKQFQGDAGDAYRTAAKNYAATVKAAAAHSRDAAQAFEVAGAIVGTVRGTIRDDLSQFAADELIEGMAALALSPETFGGSIAAWTVATVGQGASLAASNASKVTKVVEKVSSLISKAKSSAKSLEDGGKQLAEGADKAEHAAQSGARNAERGAEDGAAGAHSGEHGGEGTKTESTPAQTREELGPKYRQSTQDAANAQQRLTQTVNRQHQADSELSAAQSDLAAAHTPQMVAAAQRRIASAQAHQASYAEQAQRAQHDVQAAQKAQRSELKEYRESLKNDNGPLSEETLDRLEHVKEATQQGKESTNKYNDSADEADKGAAEINDGSLVGGEGE